MTYALLQDAMTTRPPLSRKGLLDRLFAWWFGRFVYNQIWEDPRVDLEALALRPDSHVVTIASGGCNVLAYLAAGPRRVTAVDLNPCHVHLTRLKLAAARYLPSYDDFFAMFGDGADPGNISRYDAELRWRLPPDSRAYWDERIHWFADGFYRRSLLGRFIGVLHGAGRMLGFDPRRMLSATSLEEQEQMFERHVAPVFDRLPVRLAGRMPFVLYSLGIPPAQMVALRRAANDDDLADLCRKRVRRLACAFPLADNCFAWQAFGRSYDPSRAAVPEYLQPAAYEAIRASAERGSVHLTTVTDHLAALADASVDAVVLLDAQDWMDAPQLTALWTEIGRACRRGARIVFRTAAAESPLPDHLPPDLLSRFDYHAARSRELATKDRSAIYGGFHLYTLER